MKIKFLNFIIFILLAFLAVNLFLSPLTYAQGGLVPCGSADQKDCGPCDFLKLTNNVIGFLFKDIVLPLAALGILSSGIVILTAGGTEGRITLGKSMLWNIIIGFFIAFGAWLIISTMLAHLTPGAELVPATWNPLTNDFPGCPAFEPYE